MSEIVSRYKICPWGKYDERADEVVFTYGIQARVNGMWAHVARDGKPLFFAKAEDAEAEVKRLNEELRSKAPTQG